MSIKNEKMDAHGRVSEKERNLKKREILSKYVSQNNRRRQ